MYEPMNARDIVEAVVSGPQLDKMLGISRATRWRLMSDPNFPQPVRLTPSGRRPYWRKGDIDAWLERLTQDAPASHKRA